MARVAYNASVKQFVTDWDTNRFMDIMCNGAALNRIGGSVSEKKSLEANASKLRSLISLSHLPDATELAWECIGSFLGIGEENQEGQETSGGYDRAS